MKEDEHAWRTTRPPRLNGKNYTIPTYWCYYTPSYSVIAALAIMVTYI